MRYVYLGDRWTGDEWAGAACDPVRDQRGKAIVGRSKALVRNAAGELAVVNRRRLRLMERL